MTDNFPFEAGRVCTQCDTPLSRYTEGPDCRQCTEDEVPARHRIVREALRHYKEIETLAQESGDYVLSWGDYDISFLDLQGSLEKLSKRKKEAVLYNVILDWKQKDVAERMGITTVSVGQYVEQACLQIEEAILGRYTEERD